MNNPGSVAPKERVNITYRAATGGLEEEVELPLPDTGGDPIRVYEDGTIRLSDGRFTRGTATKQGYRVVTINRKKVGVHNLVKVAHDRRRGIDGFADPTKVSFDHKNQIRADNRYENIRAASLEEQIANRTITHSNASKRSKPIRGRPVNDPCETAGPSSPPFQRSGASADLRGRRKQGVPRLFPAGSSAV